MTVRDYQVEGVNWLLRAHHNGMGAILGDEMGLGKTLQSISIIAYMWQHLNIKGPHLIMVPKSTLSNWMNEFKRFTPQINVLRFHGSKEEREQFADRYLKYYKGDNKREFDVVVTTYEVVNLERNANPQIRDQPRIDPFGAHFDHRPAAACLDQFRASAARARHEQGMGNICREKPPRGILIFLGQHFRRGQFGKPVS